MIPYKNYLTQVPTISMTLLEKVVKEETHRQPRFNQKVAVLIMMICDDQI